MPTKKTGLHADAPNPKNVIKPKQLEEIMFSVNTLTESLLGYSDRFLGFYWPGHPRDPMLIAQVAQIMATLMANK